MSLPLFKIRGSTSSTSPRRNSLTDDIPANRIVLLDTTNLMTTTQPRGVVLPSAGGGVAGTFGVTVDLLYKRPSATANVRPGRVAITGSGIGVIADGAITAGQYVQASDTAGKLGYAKVAALGFSRLAKLKQPPRTAKFVSSESTRPATPDRGSRRRKTHEKHVGRNSRNAGQAVAPVHYDPRPGSFAWPIEMVARGARLGPGRRALRCASRRVCDGYALDQSL